MLNIWHIRLQMLKSDRKRHLYLAAALRLANQHFHIADLIDKYLNNECSKKDLHEAILAVDWGYASGWLIATHLAMFSVHKLVVLCRFGL